MKNEEVKKFSESIKEKIAAIVEEKGLTEQAEKYLHKEIFSICKTKKNLWRNRKLYSIFT